MIENLKHQLTQTLPGKDSQYKMAHAVRVNLPPTPANARVACVLILLYPKNGVWHFVLIQRMSTHKDDRHSGQISFPGGKLEQSDASLADGALREAEEEVGINSKDVELLGQLTDLYIPVSNFLVHPFIGKIDYEPIFIPQPTEVQSILEVPISVLQDPTTAQKTVIKISEQITLKDVPFFNVENHVVWGATAMILSEFLHVINKID